MKRFEKSKMVLFDSTNANFRLGVEGQFTRSNPDGTRRDIVYVSNKMIAYLNPNIYLTLEYKSDELPTAIYTSYPQLFKLRKAFGKVMDILESEKGFSVIGGELKVNSAYADPVVVSGIGKNNNWISIRLCVISSGENGVTNTEPGVSIELSTAEKCLSVFNVDEFSTLYTIINDIDLAGISATMSMAFLSCDSVFVGQQAYGYPQQPVYPSVPPVASPDPYQPQPQTMRPGNYAAPHAPQPYAQPRYNNTPRYQQNSRPAPRAAVPQQNPYQQPAAPEQQTPMMAPRQTQKQPLMNPSAIEDTPISETFNDDMNAIDEIFNTDDDE